MKLNRKKIDKKMQESRYIYERFQQQSMVGS